MNNLELIERIEQLEHQMQNENNLLKKKIDSLQSVLKRIFRDCVFVGFPRELDIGDTNLNICKWSEGEREGWLFRRNISPDEFDFEKSTDFNDE